MHAFAKSALSCSREPSAFLITAGSPSSARTCSGCGLGLGIGLGLGLGPASVLGSG